VFVSVLFLLRRVGAEVRAAGRLSAGDLGSRAEVRGADEIALMARAFNTMAERLQGRVKDEEEAREQLAERVNELDLLNQMGDLLQSCFTLDEAYGIFSRLAPRLFPAEGGAIFALDASRDLIEPVATWGPNPPDAAPFPVENCWALRHGRTHVVLDTTSGVLCQHLPKPVPSAYLCTPLAPQGKALGVLFVMVESAPGTAPRTLSHAKQRLAEAVAGQLGLGLGNVQLREVLRIQSIHDPLTGLFNRRYMEETLEREVHRARRNARPMSVLMLDIDSFKQQNDAFGHEAGDAVLRELGALLKGSLRREDIPCRYGGEEFVLVLPEASLDGAARRAEQLREAVKRLRIPFRDRSIGPITVSVGVAAFPDHGEDGHAVLQAADAALYEAKRAGRDRISVATLHPTV
jgi:diguanylate cyclase (GGDEF)-like protein